MKNLQTYQTSKKLLDGSYVNFTEGVATGKVTKNGLREIKNGVAFTISVGTTEYDLKGAEYVLQMDKEAHLSRRGENPKYPLIFVSCAAYGNLAEAIKKNGLHPGDLLRVMGDVSLNDYKGEYSIAMTIRAWEKERAPEQQHETEEVIVEESTDDLSGLDW